MVTAVLNQAFLSASTLVSHGAPAGHGPATSLTEMSTSSPQTAAFAATLVVVCTPVASGGMRTLKTCGL